MSPGQSEVCDIHQRPLHAANPTFQPCPGGDGVRLAAWNTKVLSLEEERCTWKHRQVAAGSQKCQKLCAATIYRICGQWVCTAPQGALSSIMKRHRHYADSRDLSCTRHLYRFLSGSSKMPSASSRRLASSNAHVCMLDARSVCRNARLLLVEWHAYLVSGL